jgi:ethanolamine ammonia-lyase small subunit
MTEDLPAADPWRRLRLATPARIGLGRVGDAPPVSVMLDFQMAHARARDAVHAALDTEGLAGSLGGEQTLLVRSQASDRGTYLRRPDLGRKLNDDSRQLLQPGDWDAAFVVADGLSAIAVHRQAPGLLAVIMPGLAGWRIAPPVIATQGRVALGDEIGSALGARICVMLIGERPGLSVADSLGIYLTYAPRPGRRDSERNCISNIHGAGGLSHTAAAAKLLWLMTEARRRKLTGIALKDDGPGIIGSEPQNGLPAD